MHIHLPLIQQPLHLLRQPRPKLPVLRICLSPILPIQRNFAPEDRQRQQPGRGDGVRALGGDRLPEGLEGDVAPARAAKSTVAELGGLCQGEAVESVGEGVFRVGADGGGAVRIVVVEDGFGAEAAGQVEVGGGAGGYWAEAGSIPFLRLSIMLYTSTLLEDRAAEAKVKRTVSAVAVLGFPWQYCHPQRGQSLPL